MFEFRWTIPGDPPEDAVLRIHSRSGWFGRKQLICGSRTVFRRGWFEGLEARFTCPDGRHDLALRLGPIAGTSDWRPVLQCDGQELHEITGNAPPHIVRPPISLAVPVGLTYLLLFLTVVMSPQAGKILDALYLRFDDRKAVLTVIDPQAPPETLSIDRSQLVPAVQGRPYAAQLKPVGGTPPYTWSQDKKRWPKGLNLNPDSGELTCTPTHARDYLAKVTLTDSTKQTKQTGQTVEQPIVFVVQPRTPPGSDWPTITVLALPPATVGEPYEFSMAFTGGLAPHTWKTVGKGRLPEGLVLDKTNGKIHGAPRKAGAFPVTIRVIDDRYAASRDIVPWIIPILATAVCLLGFVSMRRWGVFLYAVLIVLQVGFGLAAVLPLSVTALGLQVVLWLAGAAHLGKMR